MSRRFLILLERATRIREMIEREQQAAAPNSIRLMRMKQVYLMISRRLRGLTPPQRSYGEASRGDGVSSAASPRRRIPQRPLRPGPLGPLVSYSRAWRPAPQSGVAMRNQKTQNKKGAERPLLRAVEQSAGLAAVPAPLVGRQSLHDSEHDGLHSITCFELTGGPWGPAWSRD